MYQAPSETPKSTWIGQICFFGLYYGKFDFEHNGTTFRALWGPQSGEIEYLRCHFNKRFLNDKSRNHEMAGNLKWLNAIITINCFKWINLPSAFIGTQNRGSRTTETDIVCSQISTLIHLKQLMMINAFHYFKFPAISWFWDLSFRNLLSKWHLKSSISPLWGPRRPKIRCPLCKKLNFT